MNGFLHAVQKLIDRVRCPLRTLFLRDILAVIQNYQTCIIDLFRQTLTLIQRHNRVFPASKKYDLYDLLYFTAFSKFLQLPILRCILLRIFASFS